MDPKLAEDLLAQYDDVVAHGIELIARQKRLIDDLRRCGLETEAADRTLRNFETTHARHLANRDRLRCELVVTP